MNNLHIKEGCIGCGACETICREVFEVKRTASVRKGADIEKYEECIKEAVRLCPVSVIKYED